MRRMFMGLLKMNNQESISDLISQINQTPTPFIKRPESYTELSECPCCGA